LGDILNAIAVVLIGLLVVGLVLGGLYAVTTQLPAATREWAQRSLFLGPALVLLAVGLVIPVIRTTISSLYDDSASEKFVAFGNFVDIFKSTDERSAIINTLLWVIFGTLFSTVFGLAIARFADRMKGEAIAKAFIFLPSAIALVGAGLIWKFVYAGGEPNVGLLNQIIAWLHLPSSWGENGLWLIDDTFRLNTFLLIVILVWVQTGFATVVFSAAIKGVPDAMLEAARVDGATEREVFFKVVVPSIRATIVTVITTTVIAALKVFDIVKASTGGNFNTSTIANNNYDHFFIDGRPNLGSALAVILFVMVIPVVVINQRNQARAKELGG
jgi:alpha-glucoside transport system permease protein